MSTNPLIFEHSRPGRRAAAQIPRAVDDNALADLPAHLRREGKPALPEVSEPEVVRHYTNTSAQNFAIDKQFYPLGSCTMKYNPRGANKAAMMPGFLARHPLAPERHSQGYMECMHELQDFLKEVTGMEDVSLAPMAGAQGEFSGVAMIRKYHEANGDDERSEILIPEAAHGTNPATAVMCGYKVREVPVGKDGDVDLDALKEAVGPQTAGLMMTNPSTCGVFERKIEEIAKTVHDAGGLLYYDGANLNAILGKVRPGDMGFDVIHMNLHKTFATPHGGGGPGAGPVGVSKRLQRYMPTPVVGQRDNGSFYWKDTDELPDSIGHLSAFMGNAGVLLRAYFYAMVLGREGMIRVGEYSTLAANYLSKRLQDVGCDAAYPSRRASHEFLLTFARQAKHNGVTAVDVAKRLLDYNQHAPTVYFPLLVPECFLIEPTETETKEALDRFVDAMENILKEAKDDPDLLHGAPYTQPLTRLDEVQAAKELDLAYKEEGAA